MPEDLKHAPITETKIEPHSAEPPTQPPKIFPSLSHFDSNPDDQLSPQDQETLEGQAARYHGDEISWGPAPLKRPPPPQIIFLGDCLLSVLRF